MDMSNPVFRSSSGEELPGAISGVSFGADTYDWPAPLSQEVDEHGHPVMRHGMLHDARRCQIRDHVIVVCSPATVKQASTFVAAFRVTSRAVRSSGDSKVESRLSFLYRCTHHGGWDGLGYWCRLACVA